MFFKNKERINDFVEKDRDGIVLTGWYLTKKEIESSLSMRENALLYRDFTPLLRARKKQIGGKGQKKEYFISNLLLNLHPKGLEDKITTVSDYRQPTKEHFAKDLLDYISTNPEDYTVPYRDLIELYIDTSLSKAKAGNQRRNLNILLKKEFLFDTRVEEQVYVTESCSKKIQEILERKNYKKRELVLNYDFGLTIYHIARLCSNTKNYIDEPTARRLIQEKIGIWKELDRFMDEYKTRFHTEDNNKLETRVILAAAFVFKRDGYKMPTPVSSKSH